MKVLVPAKFKDVWTSFPIFASYCSDILNEKDMLALRHGFSGIRQCTLCTSTMEYMKNGPCAHMGNRQQAFLVRTGVKKPLKD